MKEGDFRIGIHVKYEGSEITLDEDYLEVLLAVRNYEDYEPIHLTEEWLVKLGFKLGASEIGSAYYHKGVGIYDFCIRFYRVTQSLYFCLGNEQNSSYEPKYFVHQLQNLYFALTGEELTIK